MGRGLLVVATVAVRDPVRDRGAHVHARMFLVAWGYLAVLRALERPTLGRLRARDALVAAVLLYTQYWSLYLLATVGVRAAAARVARDDADGTAGRERA